MFNELIENRINRILGELHPVCEKAFRDLTNDLKASAEKRNSRWTFLPFEGLRTPARQQDLLAKRPPVTHVGKWYSPHQYGLAVDFVPYDGNSWDWSDEHNWDMLKQAAVQRGLSRPYDWDKPHIQCVQWIDLQAMVNRWRRGE